MANKIKKAFAIGSVIAGLFLAISACDSHSENPSSNFDYSSSLNNSDSEASSSSLEPQVVLEGISVTNNKTSYEYGEELDITVTAQYSNGTSNPVTN